MKKTLFYFVMIIFIANAMFNCTLNHNQPEPQLDITDFFVGNYSGNYAETGVNSGALDRITQTTISKKSANEVLIHVEAKSLKTSFDVVGVVKNDIALDLPLQTVNGKELKYIGFGELTTNLSESEPCDTVGIDAKSTKFIMSFILKTATDTTKMVFVGVKK
jgi:hypothetical protein